MLATSGAPARVVAICRPQLETVSILRVRNEVLEDFGSIYLSMQFARSPNTEAPATAAVYSESMLLGFILVLDMAQ